MCFILHYEKNNYIAPTLMELDLELIRGKYKESNITTLNDGLHFL